MTPHRKRILCVEDDDDVCSMLTNLLSLVGYEITIARTVSEALRDIEEKEFELYLLENWLPGGTGIELCKVIRAASASVPIIFYSSAAYEDDRRAALDAGANVYLFKPSDIDKLLDTIKRLSG